MAIDTISSHERIEREISPALYQLSVIYAAERPLFHYESYKGESNLKYVLVLLLAILSTVKVGFQSEFSKKTVKNTADVLMFNFFVFLFSGIIFSYGLIGADKAVLIYAAIGALFTALFQLSYTEALSEKKWLFFAVSAMLATTAASSVQQIFSKSPYAAQNRAYVPCVYLIGSLLIFLMYVLLKRQGKGKTFQINKRVILLAMASGICLGLYKFVSTYSMSVVDGTFFPARAGGIILFSTLSGVLIFKDKLIDFNADLPEYHTDAHNIDFYKEIRAYAADRGIVFAQTHAPVATSFTDEARTNKRFDEIVKSL
ncbi:MAG: hypothetical protein IJ493_12280 [Clostridia bacterium]|nr:hypothetical protein [Clostridia bacterium]